MPVLERHKFDLTYSGPLDRIDEVIVTDRVVDSSALGLDRSSNSGAVELVSMHAFQDSSIGCDRPCITEKTVILLSCMICWRYESGLLRLLSFKSGQA